MKLRRMLLATLGLVIIVTLAVISVALTTAEVELTQTGVHKRLLIPLGKRTVGLQIYSGTGEGSAVSIKSHVDGPIVKRDPEGGWSASWFCENKVASAEGKSSALIFQCGGRRFSYSLSDAPQLEDVAPMPDKLLVISDLEGNLAFLERSLQQLGVIDTNGRWTYETGHLLVLGDSVDRGRDALGVLWKLRELAIQASEHGGGVRVVLGNHEQYALRGNISRANAEHRYALRKMGGMLAPYESNTVIGAWLKMQPVAVKLGDVLFVHGGVSPDVINAGMSIASMNEAMRGYWQEFHVTGKRSKALDAVLGDKGVTQYRGYLYGVDGLYPKASLSEIEQVLKHFQVSRVVVAHTMVDHVESLYGGKVYAIDVNSNEAAPELLLFEKGVPRIVAGVKRGLVEKESVVRRPFRISQAADRTLLANMVSEYREISKIPHPY